MSKPLCVNDPTHGQVHARDWCRPCYRAGLRSGQICRIRLQRRAADVLEDYDFLRRQGLSVEQIAARLGYREGESLARALSRARARGIEVPA